jgi:hypothetical protein
MMFYYLAHFAIGAGIAVATLPWKDRIGSKRDGAFWWIVAWTLFWPYLVLWGLWCGMQAYRRAWWDYSDRQQAKKHRK